MIHNYFNWSVIPPGDATILDFLEGPYGSGWPSLTPVQTFLLKLRYNLELTPHPTIKLPAAPNTYVQYRRGVLGDSFDSTQYGPRILSEIEYLQYLQDEGRCNMTQHQVVPPKSFFLVGGRRSGKTLLAHIMLSYDAYILAQQHHTYRAVAKTPFIVGPAFYSYHKTTLTYPDSPEFHGTETSLLVQQDSQTIVECPLLFGSMPVMRKFPKITFDEVSPLYWGGNMDMPSNFFSTATPTGYPHDALMCRDSLKIQIPTWEARGPDAEFLHQRGMSESQFLSEFGAFGGYTFIKGSHPTAD